jgi:ferredoxin
MPITKVWLDESRELCTMCGLCQTLCPTVFTVPDKMHVLPNADLTQEEDIAKAAEFCPVSTIAFEKDHSQRRDNAYAEDARYLTRKV